MGSGAGSGASCSGSLYKCHAPYAALFDCDTVQFANWNEIIPDIFRLCMVIRCSAWSSIYPYHTLHHILHCWLVVMAVYMRYNTVIILLFDPITEGGEYANCTRSWPVAASVTVTLLVISMCVETGAFIVFCVICYKKKYVLKQLGDCLHRLPWTRE